ncbi:hypothetical protein AGABI1DRAFT_75662 [Agaricus bisporus var. burnettii JB137-S8]|uniref:DUF3533 domain-containing protein n=1 Tax=Agaricus bisporus var. burnettii (strain JB137-S8 / ATCC MYA-4627 / FGSC 10392) TaxID=597362 RepID=K5XT60_AGABU|nr:uncharacterized protein AGABI1DRAFT_75662 [Agaricus bisporus var. burnettii JB137-S8]EKM78185.1 hypothetical protein AGABI1DRAFT_75662 [Agaricus bisporus var. burnettii JB137-S8]
MNGQVPIIPDHGTTRSSLSSSPTTERSYIPSKGEQVREEAKTLQPAPQSRFFAKTEALSQARRIYFKTFIPGFILIILVVFAVFPIYWGSLWKVPAHPVDGWIVDYDGGQVGEFFMQNIPPQSNNRIVWSRYPGEQLPSIEQLENDITEERIWAVIAVNSGASNRLNETLQTPSGSYNGKTALTVYAAEARNEFAYRNLISPTVIQILDQLSQRFAIQFTQQVASSTSAVSLANVALTSPQLLTLPVYFTMVNLRPFDEPVASAPSFVGLIYLLILSFFITMIGEGARNASGLSRILSWPAYARLRIITAVIAYFFVSLMYSLLNVAFQIDFTRHFGRSGFMAFWMLNWAGMMAVGLALESMITLLTTRFIPFFMITWILSNVSVCIAPIQVLPGIYRYGYAAPFYNLSRGFRTIAFSTKNQLGLNFGILIAWVVISCITLPLFQWLMWRRNQKAVQRVS